MSFLKTVTMNHVIFRFHLQENSSYPDDLDEMSLRTLCKVYINGKAMSTLRNKVTVHKIGQLYSIDQTEIDNGMFKIKIDNLF